jgi:hypothetical protein
MLPVAEYLESISRVKPDLILAAVGTIVLCKTPWNRLRIENLLVIMLIFLGSQLRSQPSTPSFPC